MDKSPRIFMYLEGGVVHSIVADQPVDIMILDADCDEGGEFVNSYIDCDGIKFDAVMLGGIGAEVEINPKIVDHYFKQIKK